MPVSVEFTDGPFEETVDFLVVERIYLEEAEPDNELLAYFDQPIIGVGQSIAFGFASPQECADILLNAVDTMEGGKDGDTVAIDFFGNAEFRSEMSKAFTLAQQRKALANRLIGL